MAFMRPLTPASALEDGLTPCMNSRGDPFVQLHQRVPCLKYFYTSFEVHHDSVSATNFARDHSYLPILIAIFYMTAVFFGLKYMEGRERLDLRYKLAYWNAFLSFFSFMGAVRTVPDLLYRIGSEPLEYSICTPPTSSWGSGATGLWVQLFIFSKIPELIDTYFIVARKRPLIFLHWYHHVTVLLYCWHSYATEAPQALYFVAMNYSVHAIMYGYYCLQALKIKPPIPPFVITMAQISQMFVGVAVQAVASFKYLTRADDCVVNGANIFWGGMMYASYFALFTKFALSRYSKKEKKI